MERNTTIDYIKFFAIFFIVCIHTTPFSKFQYGDIDGMYINFIFDVFARFGVPYFFVVSGYLLEQKLSSGNHKSDYLKKYLIKIAKLLIIWYLFFLLYDFIMITLESLIKGINYKVEILKRLDPVLNITNLYYGYGIKHGTSSHLWYLSILIWSIIILYIFIKIRKVGMLLLISFILNLIGLFGQSYSMFFELPLDTRDALFFGLFYVTLGYYLSNIYSFEKIRLKPKLLLILFFVFSSLQIIESELLVGFFGGKLGNYYLFTIPLVVCLMLYALKNPNLKNPFIVRVGANSVGIYVIHPLFISLSYNIIGILNVQKITHSFIWNLLFTPFIFIISYYSYKILQITKTRLKQLLKVKKR